MFWGVFFSCEFEVFLIVPIQLRKRVVSLKAEVHWQKWVFWLKYVFFCLGYWGILGFIREVKLGAHSKNYWGVLVNIDLFSYNEAVSLWSLLASCEMMAFFLIFNELTGRFCSRKCTCSKYFFLASEHLNSLENEPVLISGKMNWHIKQHSVRLSFSSTSCQPIFTIWRPGKKNTIAKSPYLASQTKHLHDTQL